VTPTVTDGPVPSTVETTWAALVAAGRENTYLGAGAMKLAARIDGATAVMGFAGLLSQLEKTMTSALAGAVVATDLVDELEERRERKFAGA
jgi:uncharacterized protein YbcI